MEHGRIGERLRRARELAGLTQDEAVRGLDISPGALGHYEAGRRGVDALMLERLARRFGVPVGFFFDSTDAEPVPDWEGALRARATALSAAGKQGISTLIRRMHALEELVERTDAPLPPAFDSPFRPLPDERLRDDDIAACAEDARRHFDLGVTPLTNVGVFLEEQGALTFAVPLGGDDDDLSGLFFRHDRLGPVAVVNQDQAPTRRPFTFAHEFAHALYHYDRTAILCRSVDRRPVEHFADRFASYFLIPPTALQRRLSELRRGNVAEGVVRLARHFGVSFGAMKRRLELDRHLSGADDLSGVQPVALAKSLGYEVPPHELGSSPLPLEEQVPRLFLELAYRAVREGQVTTQRAAGLLGVSDIEFEERLAALMEDDVCARNERYA